MNKLMVMALMVMCVATILCGTVMAYAPNSGDGISDGSVE